MKIETEFNLKQKVWVITHITERDEFYVVSDFAGNPFDYKNVRYDVAPSLLFRTKEEAQAECDRRNKNNGTN